MANLASGLIRTTFWRAFACTPSQRLSSLDQGGYAMNIRKHPGPGQGHELLEVEASLLFHQPE
jgi:hypothetical protein